MGFLGSIGIDVKLLIAQIVNFLFLVLILKKYIYKPFIRQLEEDEATLTAAKAEKEKSEEEEKAADEKKQVDIADAQKKSASIIAEASDLAAKIKKDARDQTQKEKDQLIAAFKERLQKATEILEREKKQQMEQDLARSVSASLVGQLDEDTVRNLQESFFRQLLEEVKKLPSAEVASEKPVILFSAVPMREHQKELLQNELTNKLPNVSVEEQQKKELLSGFRLELPNHRIDSNLAFEITNIHHE